MGSELVGGDRELAELSDLLAAARAGNARLVLCGGEPSIGRTRLASELAARSHQRTAVRVVSSTLRVSHEDHEMARLGA